jgi:cellulose synthase/poly-beta-1,6-N-acetylglucosamine synthase-like glycosyltransferase
MISIIVPSHNAAQSITACVTALCQQETAVPYEIIVVADGCTDATAQLAEAAGARVLQQAQQGPAAARNVGLHAAQGDIICFTDADCVPRPDWLAAMIAPLQADPEVVGVKGIYATCQKELTARFVQLEYEDKYDRLLRFDHISFMDSYSAACRRQVLLEIGGFDEHFKTASVEDRELSYRLAAQGHKMVFQPRAVVVHSHTPSLAGYIRKKFFNGYWNARVLRQFPERLIEDTYTPHVQKLQILLMGSILATGMAALLIPLFWAFWLLLALLFLMTTLPFVAKAWAKDRPVALIAPFMLGVRGLALGIGYLCGLLNVTPRP